MHINMNVINHLKKLVHFFNEQKTDYAFTGEFPFSPWLEIKSTMDIDIILRVKESEMLAFIGRIEKEFESILAHDEPMRLRSMKIWRVIHRLDNHLMILNFLLAESVFYENIFKRTHEIDFFESKLKILTSEDLPFLKNWTELAQGNSNSDKVNILPQAPRQRGSAPAGGSGFQCKNKFEPDRSEKVICYE